MGQIAPAPPVRLFCGIIFLDEKIKDRCLRALERRYGPIHAQSPVFDFNTTPYYEKEIGAGLRRIFVSFHRLLGPEKLASVKLFTNALERRTAHNDRRRSINIDPGYLNMAKVVLATTKDFVHRIYVGDGIYEEVTLHFSDKTFRPGPWIYPDFRRADHIALFNAWRELYRDQIGRKS